MAQRTAAKSVLGTFGKFKCEVVQLDAGSSAGDFYISALQEVDWAIPWEGNANGFAGSLEIGSATVNGVTKTNAVKCGFTSAALTLLLLGR